MKYSKVIDLIESTGSSDADICYILRLLQTFETIKTWNKDDNYEESREHLKAIILILEFVGVKNVVSDWKKIRGRRL